MVDGPLRSAARICRARRRRSTRGSGADAQAPCRDRKSPRSVAAPELFLHALGIETPRSEQDVASGTRGRRAPRRAARRSRRRRRAPPRRPPPPLSGPRLRRPGRGARQRRSLRGGSPRARRRHARATARSTTRPPCGTRGRRGRREGGSRRRRSRRGSPRSQGCCRRSRPCASTPAAIGSRTTPRRSRGCGGAPLRPSRRASTPGRCPRPGRSRASARPGSDPDVPSRLLQLRFELGQSLRPLVHDRGDDRSLGSHLEGGRQMRCLTGSAGGDHRHLDRLGECAR